MIWESEIEGFKGYLKVEKGLSDNSIHAYVTDLTKLVQFLKDRGLDQEGPEGVTLNNLKEMIEWIAQKELVPEPKQE